jgi:AcrR family transcriptional regulator
MPADSDTTSARRSRISPARELEFLNAVLDVLGEVSYEELSMDLVAARARCSKSTLYKLWPTKLQLVAAALYATRPMRPDEVDTGTLRGDLLAMVGQLAAAGQAITSLFTALGHAMLTDQELATAVHTSLLEPWFGDLIAFVDRAVDRGELPSRPPAADFLPEVLFSVAVTRPLFGRGLADLDYLTRCVDEVLLPMLLPSALRP